jgi:hypothetical protein
VAFLVRQAGPASQTEVHFYPSRAQHRYAAKDVVARARDAR